MGVALTCPCGGASLLQYSVGDDFGVFSNSGAHPITLDGKRWPTSEHYFQAQKYRLSHESSRARSVQTRMRAHIFGYLETAKLQIRQQRQSLALHLSLELAPRFANGQPRGLQLSRWARR